LTAAKVRLPAVAGLFYPQGSNDLARVVDEMLSKARSEQIHGIRALICPHAGYEYSGPVAASAYKLIQGGAYKKVVILAASHYALFQGASVPSSSAYETPLGRAPVADLATTLGKLPPFVIEPQCQLRRPSWSGIASKPEPPAGEDTPDTWEHSVEVQIPFLQRVLGEFSILPIIFGQADPEQVAQSLAPLVDDKTLVIASTDLSHYHPYEEARDLDRLTIQWITGMEIAALRSEKAEDCACGRVPVIALLRLAKIKGWKPQLLDARNSGDTSGKKDQVVGYAAFAFIQAVDQKINTNDSAKNGVQFGPEERRYLLQLARKTLASVASGGEPPDIKPDSVPGACLPERGCFVTLTVNSQLRGCIGNIIATGPLYKAVIDNARNAALRDPRFKPVTSLETSKIHIEVSVLTDPVPLPFDSPEHLLRKLQPHKDGVILRIGRASATFLPQVWEQLPDKVRFLEELSEKAGCKANAWRGKDVTVSVYRVEAFEEPK
jgi:AmmeMemoRadiSam system protein A